ncbi:phage holin family protein [Sporolactobacillus nakayamae]|uniref:Holin, Cph1 family n=1 Tax=Sporolactobacillus nakayamae TaxID=269670 RepID=A0A1I2N973_9BACL|nr:holin family protein [Sporolactobacillus nakayamae]SFF99429.1 holin, Cph1 family [Sporolactobacillus nakayamae]
MTKYELFFRSIAALLGAVSGYLYGEWSSLIAVLVAFVVIDYISGLIAAAYIGSLSSKIGFQGIAKKVMLFTIVAAAHLCDVIVGSKNIIMDATIYFYLANELLSILENAGRIGLPVPNQIKKLISVLKEKSGGE